jgi:hypothetical protein
LILLSLVDRGFSQENVAGPFEAVRIINFSGTLEAFYPDGTHVLFKTGEVPPAITPEVSGLILRVIRGTLTIEVESIVEARSELDELSFLTSDLVRISLSAPDKNGKLKWEIFRNASKTSIDRGLSDTTEIDNPGEGSLGESGREFGVEEPVPVSPSAP